MYKTTEGKTVAYDKDDIASEVICVMAPSLALRNILKTIYGFTLDRLLHF